MASGSRVPYRDLYNKDINDDLNYLITNLRSCLIDETEDFGPFFTVLYEKAYNVVYSGHSDDLYSCVRALIVEYIDHLVRNLDFKTNDFLISLNDLWFKFIRKAEFIRNVLLYSERVFETSVTGGSITHFIWSNFCEIILESNNFKLCFELKECRSPEAISLAKGFQTMNLLNIENDIKSKILNIDCLLDVFSFFSISQLVKFSLISSQMDKFSNYLLNKRSHKLCSIKVCKEWKSKSSYGIYQLNLPKKRLGTLLMPLDSLPVWINGVKTIRFINPNVDCIEFLKLFEDYLFNCHLLFGQRLWKNLHENGQLLNFLKLFNDRCFSFEQEVSEVMYRNSGIMGELFPLMWPLWAIFNGIFLKQCRDIHLKLELLYFNGSSFMKWLHHPITENEPRRLKLFGGTIKCQLTLDISSLIQKLKENFMLAAEKRMFYIQFPLNNIDRGSWGEWNNQIGEKLVINNSLITRLPLEYSQKKFEDFYKHLNEINLPKVEIF